MFLADALSRAYLPRPHDQFPFPEFDVHAHCAVVATEVKKQDLIMATQNDPNLASLMNVQESWPWPLSMSSPTVKKFHRMKDSLFNDRQPLFF
jgi:hypothetical protein